MREKLGYCILIYLRELAKLQLKKTRPQIIGVTASAGKTSLTHAIAAVLRDRFSIKASYKANSESGLPLNILGLDPGEYRFLDWLRVCLLAPFKLLTNWPKYEIYIAEMGIDHPDPPKNMEYLLTIIRPDIGVFLNAFAVHSQFFDGLVPDSVKNENQRAEFIIDLIAQEKGKLIRSLPQKGTAVLNLDDKRVRRFVDQTPARVITFATKGRADFTASNPEISLSGFSMLITEGSAKKRLQLDYLLDEHYAQTLLSAVAVGRSCGIPLADCVDSLEKNFRLPPGRMTLLEGIKDSLVLDSSYNSSPQTATSALELLHQAAKARKIAVLGDMRELGKIAREKHEELASTARNCADLILTVGPLMEKWFVPELIRLGFPKEKVESFTNPHQAAERIEKLVKSQDTILVKGSQNQIFLEIVVEKLLANPRSKNKLCRQSKFWEKKRQDLKQERSPRLLGS